MLVISKCFGLILVALKGILKNLNCRVRTMPPCEASVEVMALINSGIENRKLSVRDTAPHRDVSTLLARSYSAVQ